MTKRHWLSLSTTSERGLALKNQSKVTLKLSPWSPLLSSSLSWGLHRVRRLHVQQIIHVVLGRLLVVKGQKAHVLEVPLVPLLPSHHSPRHAPLRQIHWLDHPRYVVHEADGACGLVQYLHIPGGLPRHGQILQQFEHGMRHVDQYRDKAVPKHGVVGLNMDV